MFISVFYPDSLGKFILANESDAYYISILDN